MKKAPVTISEAARIAVASEDSVRRWFDTGQLAGFRTSGGLRLIDRASIEAFARARAERFAAKPGGQRP
jgi:excisionase family DNA binding protein